MQPNRPSTFGKTSVGRGAQINPPSRFLRIQLTDVPDQLEIVDEQDAVPCKRATQYFEDDAQSILSENQSPDIPFRYSLNPYRGCAHGCAYCYARPTHEYYGLSAGLDFESQIFVKRRAADLLRQALSGKRCQVEAVMMSGITDCYQPVERQLKITRGCLEVARDFGQPLSVITKNALVTRDIDVLSEMAQRNLARVAISITSLDQSLTRRLEPRTSSPQAKLDAMRELAAAGIPVTVMVAPVIPGLTDSEIPSILEAAKAYGATYAGYILLRLPSTVQTIFVDWLARNVPSKQANIQSLIQQTRDGSFNQSDFGTRMRGTGSFAEQLRSTFKVFAARYGLLRQTPPLDCAQFRVPVQPGQQLRLFE